MMLGLLAAALLAVAGHDRPVPDSHAGPWIIRQTVPGSPARALFTAAPSKDGANGSALLLTCDGDFLLDVEPLFHPVYADDFEATVVMPDGSERKLAAVKHGTGGALHIFATPIRNEVLTSAIIGIKLKTRDGSSRTEFFGLPKIHEWALLDKYCPDKKD